MFLTTVNVTGDMVAATVVSRNQKVTDDVEEQLSKLAAVTDAKA
jgi:hypothetical protein